MKEKKLFYIVSQIDKSLHFEWITPYLKKDFDLCFMLIGKKGSGLEEFLKQEKVPVFVLVYSRKTDLIKICINAFRILLIERRDIVDTHLCIANIVGLTASFAAGIKNRIYTRHHATIHHKKHKTGIKWDRLNNKLATRIIAISNNVMDILTRLDGVDKTKVRLLRHGFSFRYFRDISEERVRSVYSRHGIDPRSRPVIGVISRFTEWKGIQYTIAAFEKLRLSYPQAHLVLANAQGDYEREIDQLLKNLPTGSFTKISFENDVAALYRLFDIFVHVPVDEDSEAFGQTYVESLIAEVPAIFTLSGIAREFILDNENAVVVNFRDVEGISAAMHKILVDAGLRRRLTENGKRSISDFSIEKYMAGLNDLYLKG